ncbi:DUF5131 family protein, partial [Nocardia goodfellowii]
EVMASTPQHTYQVLTKRPRRARRMAEQGLTFPPNVWFGVSVEDQATADLRIPELNRIPAAVRFLSCEPLLGPVDLRWHLFPHPCPDGCGCRWPDDGDAYECGCGGACSRWAPTPALDWVIVGGESGTNSRPMHPHWVQALREQCLDAGAAFFFKQWGGRTPKQNGRTLDGRTWDQMPTVAPVVKDQP